MSTQLADLPNELLLIIISYITNIREKVRLASVNSRFHHLVTEACRTQKYKLVNHSDYLYESEYKNLEKTEYIVNLPGLLRIAPNLTHFVDKVFHFNYDYNSDSEDKKKQLSLINTKYIYLDLCEAKVYGKSYEVFDIKAEMILGNIPQVTTLDIRMDKYLESPICLMNNLKVFKFTYNTLEWLFPSRIPNDIILNAPNLEEVSFNSTFVTIDPELTEFLTDLSTHCPNLRVLEMFFQGIADPSILEDGYLYLDLDESKINFPKLEYIKLTGWSDIASWIWEKILSLAPNLKYLSFDLKVNDEIESLILEHCPNAKYNLEKPFEIEEEFRIYNQKIRGFDESRYL
ncbi:uncharacterized protein LOC128396291 [Panonychus citri]|uniref:uncharacterized protein LOC128396291 n=1 Tax=Panonychus citri TaxID=50023 RepID=UPI002307E2CA|nr:uncharacterized protein LOC128396291 [Panonychus citri]